MNKPIKNPLERLQRGAVATLCVLSAIMLLLAGVFYSCQKEPELSDEEITFNLAEKGESNPELLFGTWKPIKFAYTKNGEEILNLSMITPSSVRDYSLGMSDNHYPPFSFNDEELGPIFFLNCYFYYSRKGNFISNKFDAVFCYLNTKFPSDDEKIVYQILSKAISYVIIGDELFIYFEKIKNKNLVIFKKVDP